MGKYERIKRKVCLGLGVALLLSTQIEPVTAQTSRSMHFEASETEFGAGSSLESCSGAYCAQASIGTSSGMTGEEGEFTAAFGPLSDESEPMLEVIIEPGESNLGTLSPDSTAHRTMKVHVRSHLAGGYMLQLMGHPPRYEEYELATSASPVASIPGTELFGVNVVANTTPQVGEDPEIELEDDLLEGVLQPDYETPNRFAYTDGDVVARTEAESSQIRYTISMIVNVGGQTPAGHFASDFSAVVTPVF